MAVWGLFMAKRLLNGEVRVVVEAEPGGDVVFAGEREAEAEDTGCPNPAERLWLWLWLWLWPGL